MKETPADRLGAFIVVSDGGIRWIDSAMMSRSILRVHVSPAASRRRDGKCVMWVSSFLSLLLYSMPPIHVLFKHCIHSIFRTKLKLELARSKETDEIEGVQDKRGTWSKEFQIINDGQQSAAGAPGNELAF